MGIGRVLSSCSRIRNCPRRFGRADCAPIVERQTILGGSASERAKRKAEIAAHFEDASFYQRTPQVDIDKLVKESESLHDEIDKLLVEWEAIETEIAANEIGRAHV